MSQPIVASMDETTGRGARPEATTGEQSFLKLSASPIASLDDDRMGRRACAEALAAEVLITPAISGHDSFSGVSLKWHKKETADDFEFSEGLFSETSGM